MQLQKIKKSSLSSFDGKRSYINENESIPRIYYWQSAVKVKETLEKTRHVKKNDKYKKFILRGERKVRYLWKNSI